MMVFADVGREPGEVGSGVEGSRNRANQSLVSMVIIRVATFWQRQESFRVRAEHKIEERKAICTGAAKDTACEKR
jgi:hypothetical protein